MARYKNYEKGERIASIRMFGFINELGQLNFNYEAWLFEDEICNVKKISFRDAVSAENFMRKLGYKES